MTEQQWSVKVIDPRAEEHIYPGADDFSVKDAHLTVRSKSRGDMAVFSPGQWIRAEVQRPAS